MGKKLPFTPPEPGSISCFAISRTGEDTYEIDFSADPYQAYDGSAVVTIEQKPGLRKNQNMFSALITAPSTEPPKSYDDPKPSPARKRMHRSLLSLAFSSKGDPTLRMAAFLQVLGASILSAKEVLPLPQQ